MGDATKGVYMKIGILIIGSLIWETDKGRRDWRNDRLRVDQAVAVTAPIRYGRKSVGRDNTFTMVLSRKASLGVAKAVPCRRNTTGVDLFDEAIHLWRAESGDAHSQALSAKWGCVALLVRNETAVSDEVLSSWTQRVSAEPYYGNIQHARREEELVGTSGRFQIDWTNRTDTGEPIEFDILLATTNQPTLIDGSILIGTNCRRMEQKSQCKLFLHEP